MLEECKLSNYKNNLEDKIMEKNFENIDYLLFQEFIREAMFGTGIMSYKLFQLTNLTRFLLLVTRHLGKSLFKKVVEITDYTYHG